VLATRIATFGPVSELAGVFQVNERRQHRQDAEGASELRRKMRLPRISPQPTDASHSPEERGGLYQNEGAGGANARRFPLVLPMRKAGSSPNRMAHATHRSTKTTTTDDEPAHHLVQRGLSRASDGATGPCRRRAPPFAAAAAAERPTWRSASRIRCSRQADIAFGQPDANQVIAVDRLRWVQLTTAGYTRYDTQADGAMRCRGRGGNG